MGLNDGLPEGIHQGHCPTEDQVQEQEEQERQEQKKAYEEQMQQLCSLIREECPILPLSNSCEALYQASKCPPPVASQSPAIDVTL